MENLAKRAFSIFWNKPVLPVDLYNKDKTHVIIELLRMGSAEESVLLNLYFRRYNRKTHALWRTTNLEVTKEERKSGDAMTSRDTLCYLFEYA